MTDDEYIKKIMYKTFVSELDLNESRDKNVADKMIEKMNNNPV